MNAAALTRVARVEARLAPHDWPWARANRDLIRRDWEARRAAKPAIFNGRALMVAEARIAGDLCSARFFATDYADLLAWKDHGERDGQHWNGFAMGALLGTDGGVILGRMAAHTAAGGQLYCPCGTPDLSDARPDGRVDLEGSITREIAEETGLTPERYRLDPGWTIVREGGLMAFFRLARLAVPSDEARAMILPHLAADPCPELADIVVVRSLADLDGESVPGVVTTFLAHHFAGAFREGIA